MLVSNNAADRSVLFELPNSKWITNDGRAWNSATPPTPPFITADPAPSTTSNPSNGVYTPRVNSPPQAAPYVFPNGLGELPHSVNPVQLPPGVQRVVPLSQGYAGPNASTHGSNASQTSLPLNPHPVHYSAPPPVYPGIPAHQEVAPPNVPLGVISLPANHRGPYPYYINPYGSKNEYQQPSRTPSYTNGGPSVIAIHQESVPRHHEHYRHGTPSVQPDISYAPLHHTRAQSDSYMPPPYVQPNGEFHHGQSSTYPPSRTFTIPQHTPPGIPVSVRVMPPQNSQAGPQYHLPPGYLVVSPQHPGGSVQIANPGTAGYSSHSPGIDLHPPKVIHELNSIPVSSILENHGKNHSIHTPLEVGDAKGDVKWTPNENAHEVKRRTKSGCLTCRRRRVKCDELRPQCRNCYKAERVCLGYDTVFTSERLQRIKTLMRARLGSKSLKRRAIHPIKISATGKLYSSPETRDPETDIPEKDKSSTSLPPLLGITKDAEHAEIPIPDSLLKDDKTSNSNLDAAVPPAVKPEIGIIEEMNATGSANENPADKQTLVVNAWQQVAQSFKDCLGGRIDELLGLTCVYRAAGHVVHHFTMKGEPLANIASKVEVMRQMLMIVFPSSAYENLDVSDLTNMEKLHANDEYSILRALIEALVPDNSKLPGEIARASIAARYPQARYTRRPEQPRRMAISFSRIESLAKLLYAKDHGVDVFLCDSHMNEQDFQSDESKRLTKQLQSTMDSIVDSVGINLVSKVWEAVEIALEMIKINQTSEQEIRDISKHTASIEKVTKLAESGNPLGSLALLAFSACHSAPARTALKSTEIPPGLASTIIEIALLEK